MKLPTPVDLTSLAKLIANPECKSIALLTGAGVSVASGIPDFRSPGGMYATLRPELLTATPQQRRMMEIDPIYVVSWDIFQHNAFPYLEVRRPFILGTQQHQWKATLAHRFAQLLHSKTNRLTRVYTQNIDGLDSQCGLPDDKVVNVHGSLAQAGCERCGTNVPFDDFCQQVRTNIKDIYVPTNGPAESTPITCPKCGAAAVKPTTVLFGRSLPHEFFECSQQDLPDLDLLIVAGSSLVVGPANGLVYRVPESTIRVVVNDQPVGEDLGIEYGGSVPPERDYFAQGDCDKVFLELMHQLGWTDDLVAMKEDLPPSSQQRLEAFLKTK
eukprot:Nitzschia sp. Nitz4//scaffold414_size9364//5848//6828//NITZ4_009100-RA/size9364-processed-gene-0.3-mRNA-1//1//CDS//3329551353//9370//frame0